MLQNDRETRTHNHWMRHVARSIALIWAGWWTYFGLASGADEGLEPQ